MAHTCHAAGCRQLVPAAMFLCKKHWRMLPQLMRNLIWQHYRPGQEDEKVCSRAYSAAARSAVKWIAKMECRPEAEVREACLVYIMCQEPEDAVESSRL